MVCHGTVAMVFHGTVAEGIGARPQNLEVVSARFWLSRLAEERVRRAATRWLALLALAGFLLTLFFLGATGRGTGRWFFVLTVWMGLIFLPLWLLTQAFQSIGPALRRRLTAGVTGRTDRYRHPSSVSLVVEDLFARNVVMPRIATPEQAQKARQAASTLVARAERGGAGGLAPALRTCLAAVDGWTREMGRWAASHAAEDIQARWAEARALAALAALTKTLLAVLEDQARLSPALPAEDAGLGHAFLDAVIDYCDELALQVEVLPWTEPFPGTFEALPRSGEVLREAWRRYIEAPPPAPTPLEAFIQAALHG